MKFYTLLLAFTSLAAYSQVGVNTTDPKASLDVKAHKINEVPITTVEGLLIPRISRARAQNMQNIEESTLVYINSVTDGTETGNTVQVKTVGFYFFKDGKWLKLAPEEASFTNAIKNDGNIIKLGGELTEPTSINANGTNTLNIKGNGKNSFSVSADDKNTILSIDGASKRIGIGTTTPRGVLDINSDNSGLILPKLSDAQRDNIANADRPSGTLIYNTTANKAQINIGTPETPYWVNLDTSSNTANTVAIFSIDSNTSQIISSADPYTALIFDINIFNNTPGNFVSKSTDSKTITLKAGKNYRVDVNLGRMRSSDANHTWCRIEDVKNDKSLNSVSIFPMESTSSWNTSNTLFSIIENTGADRQIEVKCSKTKQNPADKDGSITINAGIAPVLSISILD